MSSSASSRPMAARDRGAARGPGGRSAAAHRLRGPRRSRRWISTPSWRAGPQLVLVDELAHTNAPGSRHPKRYLDVEELLAAGIDVYTTVNIQHLESLNDVVAQITRRPRARDRARPDRRRGRRDRTHRPDARRPDPAAARGQGLCPRAGRARAQALLLARQPDRPARTGAAPHRRARRRADARATCRSMPSPGPGPAGERLLVCVSEQPSAAAARALCQARRRPAARPVDGALCRDRAPSAAERGRARSRRRNAAAGRAARRRHADLPGPRIADEVLAYARETQRHPDRHRQIDALALVRDAARLGGARPGAQGGQHQRPRHSRAPARRPAKPVRQSGRHQNRSIPSPMRSAPAFVAAALGVALLISQFVELDNISLVFLAAVLASAVRYGAGAVALRRAAERALLQLLLSAAALHLHDRRSGERRRAVLLHDRGDPDQQPDGADAHADGDRAAARPRRPPSSMPSAGSSRASPSSTICCGRRPIRSPRC